MRCNVSAPSQTIWLAGYSASTENGDTSEAKEEPAQTNMGYKAACVLSSSIPCPSSTWENKCIQTGAAIDPKLRVGKAVVAMLLAIRPRT